MAFCNGTLGGEPLADWLSRPILAPTQTVMEVRGFTRKRVPPMPKVATAREWDRTAGQLRRDLLKQVVFRGEASRWRDARTKVEWLETIEGGPGYRIRKLRYEALPGLWIPALLYEPENLADKVPVVLNLNGHEPAGKAVLNKQIRCINLAKRGMLALSPEWLGMGQLNGANHRHWVMNQLDLCGTSGLAPFYLAMQRGLDVLLSLEHADSDRVAVAGLSGGGWQTIVLSALDTRVTLANPVAGYASFLTRVLNDGGDIGDSEQAPSDMAAIADYTHLTAMLAPRPTLLTYNAKDDCCFRPDISLPVLLDAARPMFSLHGKAENLRTHINEVPGTHNFDRENREAFYRLLQDHFLSANAQIGPTEIPCDAEIKTAAQLHVDLPANQVDFHTLALELSGKLPRKARIPSGTAAFDTWQKTQRKKLGKLVRAHDYAIALTKAGEEKANDITATFWQLSLDNEWTVPVVELSRPEHTGTTILISDKGRTNLVAEATKCLAAGQRVLAVDLFYFGECKLGRYDVRYALLIGALGERPLGIQTSQLNSLADWAKAQDREAPVRTIALGPRSSLIALVAAGLEPRLIDSLELQGALGSLKEIIQNNWNVEQRPEMFCFGLLETFDLKQVEALVSPRGVVKR